jgi:NAD(P)-dependent dehydrogenase (short-subunit alcohol dehydrogenase family)
MELAGSRVLITGASRGIGEAMARRFAAQGARVAVLARTEPAIKDLAAELDGTAHPADLSDPVEVRGLVERIEGDGGPIDVLVNNAGIERMGSVEELPLAEFRAVMETNYFGVIRCCQAVLPAMRRRRSGCIINVSSVAGHVAVAPMTAYTASKYALEALSECLAQEGKTFNIRVAIVEPGIIDTRMARDIGTVGAPSPYSQQRRVAALFTTVLKAPVSPSVVADKILEIAVGDTAQLRHPVGPDAEPFLGWRRGMSDEAWVELGGLDDAAWYDRIEADFGMDARPRA